MRTISKPSEGLFKDRGSKFIGYAFSVSNTDEVKECLDELKAHHTSARHFCYAYLLGEDADEYRANDDGEPGGTAGLPILNQIKSKDVSNVLVAVVRYFGGTKLGVSGLINAYKEAAKEALDKAKVVVRIPKSVVRIQFPHSSTGDVERLIRQNNWSIKNQVFAMDCIWDIETPLNEEVEHHFLQPISVIPIEN
ncbi:MAG TPA: YigZ family protein [Flavobacteriales bacterium]|nr:YigZ family protein [Flavobacteriales bacterium]